MDKQKPEESDVIKMFNKVPEVTICFWIIKVLATTVSETGAMLYPVFSSQGSLES